MENGVVAPSGKGLIDGDDSIPTLWAGITADRVGQERGDGAYLSVWINAERKHPLNSSILLLHKQLHERNEAWERADSYWLVSRSISLVEFLRTDREQGAFVQEFVKGALADLEAVGIGNLVDKMTIGK